MSSPTPALLGSGEAGAVILVVGALDWDAEGDRDVVARTRVLSGIPVRRGETGIVSVVAASERSHGMTLLCHRHSCAVIKRAVRLTDISDQPVSCGQRMSVPTFGSRYAHAGTAVPDGMPIGSLYQQNA